MCAAVNALHARYRENAGSLAKLTHYITNALPSYMDAYERDVERRALAKRQTSEMQRDLIQRFMTQSNYYYSPVTEMFFAYHPSGFLPVVHDYVLKHIHDMLTSCGCTTSVKYQVSRLILREIKNKKERNIVNAIPTSATIQCVLGLFPRGDSALSKNDIKYFLTVVGDCILKKNVGLFYFLSPRMKPFMRELSNRCYEYLGCDSMLRGFKYKFSGEYHAMRDCRLLLKHHFHNEYIHVVKSRMLDLICVATHYSCRYTSGEEFLRSRSMSFDCDLVRYTHYLKDKESADAVLADFMAAVLVPTADAIPMSIDAKDTKDARDAREFVTWKNMLFLWKRYCEGLHIPSVMYRHQLRTQLACRFEYDEDAECFVHVTSPHEPVVRLFLEFWQECAVLNQQAPSTDVEYEVEEVCGLFRAWNKNTAVCVLSESLVSKLIQHYYDDHVTVEDDKYIYGAYFPMWNKPACITDALREIYHESTSPIFSLHDLYSLYQSRLYPHKGQGRGRGRGTALSEGLPREKETMTTYDVISSTGDDVGTYGTPPSHGISAPEYDMTSREKAPADDDEISMVVSTQYMHKYMHERHRDAIHVNEENPQMSTVNLSRMFGGDSVFVS